MGKGAQSGMHYGVWQSDEMHIRYSCARWILDMDTS